MSLEFWATAASVGTFFLFAATVVGALIQLRHMRGNNQIAAAMAINQVTEGDEFQTARKFVRENLETGSETSTIDKSWYGAAGSAERCSSSGTTTN